MNSSPTVDHECGYADARPIWAEVDLGAITHNIALIRERAGRLVLFGAYQSEIQNLLRAGLLTDGAVIWSMWDGYLNQPSGQRLQAALKSANVPLIHHHTSGHASPTDLARLVHALKPDSVVPIHTEAPSAYGAAVGGNVQPHPDGAWWAV